MKPNRRQSPRRATKIKAIVVGDAGLTRLPAYVLDQSELGIRVRLAEEAVISADCYVLFAHRMEPCRVAWQSSRAAGLVFTA